MMNKDVILLLTNVKTKEQIGVAGIEAVNYCVEHVLVERTEIGNFKLTTKGEDFLDGTLSRDGI